MTDDRAVDDGDEGDEEGSPGAKAIHELRFGRRLEGSQVDFADAGNVSVTLFEDLCARHRGTVPARRWRLGQRGGLPAVAAGVSPRSRPCAP